MTAIDLAHRGGSVFGEDAQQRFLAHRLAQVRLRLRRDLRGLDHREDDHRDPARGGVLLELGQDLVATTARHEHVEEDRGGA